MFKKPTVDIISNRFPLTHNPKESINQQEERTSLGLPDAVTRREILKHIYTILKPQQHQLLFYFSTSEAVEEKKSQKQNIKSTNSFRWGYFKIGEKKSRVAFETQLKEKNDLSPKELKYCRVASDFTLLSEVISVCLLGLHGEEKM